MRAFIRKLFRRKPPPRRVAWSDQYPIEGGHALDIHYVDGTCLRRLVTESDYVRLIVPAGAPRAKGLDDTFEDVVAC